VLHVYDSLRREKVPFEPREPGRVSMYVCGPTVYDTPHVGHARMAVVFDVIRRYLVWAGNDVTFVSNVTDIDDNIIDRAAREGRTEPEVAAEYAAIYADEMRSLDVLDPDQSPHATQYVDGMIAFIEELIARDAAYVVEGRGVYFDVDAPEHYGTLVGRSRDELAEGAGTRVDVDEAKRSPLDFALWKAAKEGEPTWDTPWGPGRPGWHTECVAMSLSILGDGFDMHGGGNDLVFPHHENELAQASAADHAFARYWLHNGMVNIDGEKMSKSLGNFTTLADILEQFDPRALRLVMLQTHYRRSMEISADALDAATEGVKRVDALQRRLVGAGVEVEVDGHDRDADAVARFSEAMDDDFSTPGAVDVIFGLVRRANMALDADDADTAAAAAATAFELAGALGLRVGPTGAGDDSDIDELVAARTAARANRDFAESDRIRDELVARGIVVEDTATGTIWHRE